MGQGLNRLVFQPPSPTYGNDSNLLWLQTSKREIIPAFHIFRSASRQTILFSHGNAEDLGMIVNYFKEVADVWDANIFSYEYTGYGMSSGVPSEQNVYADIEAAYEYLTKKFKIPWHKIILYGRSLGTGASVHLASTQKVRGMILQSGLLSIHRIGLNLRLTLPGDMFASIDKIAKVKCPVFVIHGVKDEIVPFSHGMQLYNACPTAVTPYWLEDAGHNNVELTGQTEFIENIARFLKFLEVTPYGETAERLPKLELYKDPKKFPRSSVLSSPDLPLPTSSPQNGVKQASFPASNEKQVQGVTSCAPASKAFKPHCATYNLPRLSSLIISKPLPSQTPTAPKPSRVPSPNAPAPPATLSTNSLKTSRNSSPNSSKFSRMLLNRSGPRMPSEEKRFTVGIGGQRRRLADEAAWESRLKSKVGFASITRQRRFRRTVAAAAQQQSESSEHEQPSKYSLQFHSRPPTTDLAFSCPPSMSSLQSFSHWNHSFSLVTSSLPSTPRTPQGNSTDRQTSKHPNLRSRFYACCGCERIGSSRFTDNNDESESDSKDDRQNGQQYSKYSGPHKDRETSHRDRSEFGHKQTTSNWKTLNGKMAIAGSRQAGRKRQQHYRHPSSNFSVNKFQVQKYLMPSASSKPPPPHLKRNRSPATNRQQSCSTPLLDLSSASSSSFSGVAATAKCYSSKKPVVQKSPLPRSRVTTVEVRSLSRQSFEASDGWKGHGDHHGGIPSDHHVGIPQSSFNRSTEKRPRNNKNRGKAFELAPSIGWIPRQPRKQNYRHHPDEIMSTRKKQQSWLRYMDDRH